MDTDADFNTGRGTAKTQELGEVQKKRKFWGFCALHSLAKHFTSRVPCNQFNRLWGTLSTSSLTLMHSSCTFFRCTLQCLKAAFTVWITADGKECIWPIQSSSVRDSCITCPKHLSRHSIKYMTTCNIKQELQALQYLAIHTVYEDISICNLF